MDELPDEERLAEELAEELTGMLAEELTEELTEALTEELFDELFETDALEYEDRGTELEADLYDALDEILVLLARRDLYEADELYELEALDEVVTALLFDELLEVLDELLLEVDEAFTDDDSVDDVDGRQYLQTAIKLTAPISVNGELTRGLVVMSDVAQITFREVTHSIAL